MKTLQKTTALMVAIVMLLIPFLSCSSTTMINSIPDNSKLYMNGEIKGNTPYKHTDSAVSGATTEIVIKKEGYQDFRTILSKNEQVNVGAIIGGIFFLFPFIWTMGYYPTHTYELQKVSPNYVP